MDLEGDDRARLVAAYDSLRRFAAIVGPADVEPDDLVQEAYVRALRRGIGGIEHLERYLRRTIFNLSANERRGWIRRQRALGRHGVTPSSTDETFVDVSDLAALPTAVRGVLWLVEIEGWSYAEAADALGCSEGAARMRAARGRRALRTAMTEEA